MNAPKNAVNPRTHSIGIDQRLVTVRDIPAGQNLAICADRQGNEVRVALYYQRARGVLPQVGDNWLLTQETGQWMFAVYLGTGAEAFPQLPGNWNPLVLGAGWAAVSGYHVPSYRINSDGDLQLTGRISGTSNQTIATLPAGFFSGSFIVTVPCSVSASTQPFNSGQVPRLTLFTSGHLMLAGMSATATVTLDLDAAFALSAG